MLQIVMIPGLMNDGWVWRHQLGPLSRYAPVTIACNDGATSLDEMAARILAHSAGPLALVGHSMGGRIALEVVRQAPGRIAGLALLDTGVHGFREAEREGREGLVAIARREGMRAVADLWMPQMLAAARRGDGVLVPGIAAMIDRCSPEIFAAQQAAMLARADLEPLLGAIRCPTLVVTGAEDGWSPPDQHEAIAAAIPGAVLRIVAGAGHMLPVEDPAATTALLVDWAAGLRGLAEESGR